MFNAATKHCRSEMRKRRYDAYFLEDIDTLFAKALKNHKQIHETRVNQKLRQA